ncbi:hypothetical protein VH567_14420 [Sphingomonas sp. 4RDLI-65]|uniref:hypothetical protein n=1 Tax=Sphingomonas sp. 4RDLI-65 TaxID=3111641 RepID=UPI003C152AD6
MTAAITDGLLLCTHDSARSIFGAAIVDRRGEGRRCSRGSLLKLVESADRGARLVELVILRRDVPAMAIRQCLQDIHDNAVED